MLFKYLPNQEQAIKLNFYINAFNIELPPKQSDIYS
jgi:hypothetical protein